MIKHYGSFPMYSPPMENYGRLTASISEHLNDVAERIRSEPGYTLAPGRVSSRFSYQSDGEISTPLLHLATEISKFYLGKIPLRGSVASLSVITDIDAFNEHTRTVNNIASVNWHNDFKLVGHGFYHPPEGSNRIIIPMEAGPLCALGHLQIINAVQVEPVAQPAIPDQADALNLGPTVIGADGVLMKVVEDPEGAQIIQVAPDYVYGVPDTTVHKTYPIIPNGRIFFQLDSAAA